MGILTVKRMRVQISLGIALVLVMSLLLCFGKIAGASTTTPSTNYIPVNDIKSGCLNNEPTDVWDTVSDISPDYNVEYTAFFNVPFSGIHTDTWSSIPYGTTNTVGVDSVPAGTYVYSGEITATNRLTNQVESWLIPPTSVTVPNCSNPTSPYVAVASSPSVQGYWEVTSQGNVYNLDGANWDGDLSSAALNKPIVGMAVTPDGNGFWLVASDGGVFSFGDAQFYGSTGASRLPKPIVGVA